MSNRSAATTIDEYIAEFPPEVQILLTEMREMIREKAPDATETISYAIPTFDLEGRHLVHFAAFKHHIGFYPTGQGVAEFAEELEPYHPSKGSVRFPFSEPLPKELIQRIVEARVRAVRG